MRQPGPLHAFYRADPGPPRPPGRDRRLRAKARLPVLVPAHPPAGLRLRAAVADRGRSSACSSSAPAPKRRGRGRPDGPAQRGRGCARPSASSLGRPRPPTGARSATGRRPRQRERAPARHRGAHLVGRQAAKQRGRSKPPGLLFSSSSTGARAELSQIGGGASRDDLTFMRRPKRLLRQPGGRREQTPAVPLCLRRTQARGALAAPGGRLTSTAPPVSGGASARLPALRNPHPERVTTQCPRAREKRGGGIP